ncbi:DUF2760 domain-containing protein [Candidatus Methylocalor cossyra]|uniref:DUF2760 domain-containing protein n=1 Tax=Candidatus Methylocalor cossyra TaxID=3108543 RepID=A0ABM9NLK1_9GAMM
MQIDPNLIPTTLDAVHLGLAALVVILSILLILFLTVAMIALLRRRRPEPIPVSLERVPQELLPTTSLSPVRVVVERVPEQLLAAAPAREAPRPAPERPEPAVVKEATPEAALQLLGLLQKEARFLDFVQEDIAGYADAEIGAAARVVHEGCRKVLAQHFELEPVRQEQENTRITLPKGFDATAIRPTGNIVGEPPFTGTLVHRGWRASKVKLPKLAEGHNVNIIAPAEVEL